MISQLVDGLRYFVGDGQLVPLWDNGSVEPSGPSVGFVVLVKLALAVYHGLPWTRHRYSYNDLLLICCWSMFCLAVLKGGFGWYVNLAGHVPTWSAVYKLPTVHQCYGYFPDDLAADAVTIFPWLWSQHGSHCFSQVTMKSDSPMWPWIQFHLSLPGRLRHKDASTEKKRCYHFASSRRGSRIGICFAYVSSFRNGFTGSLVRMRVTLKVFGISVKSIALPINQQLRELYFRIELFTVDTHPHVQSRWYTPSAK